MRFHIDLSSVPMMKPQPASMAIIRINECTVGDSSTGNKMFKCKATILEPAELAQNQDYSTLYFILSLVPDALFRLVNLYEAAGLKDVWEENGGPATEDLPGVEVGVQLSQREYKGEIRSNVDKFFPVEGFEPKVTGEFPADDETEAVDAPEAAIPG